MSRYLGFGSEILVFGPGFVREEVKAIGMR